MAHCGKRFSISCVLVLLLTPNSDTDFSTVEVTDKVSAINYNKRIITFTGAWADAQDLCRSDRAGSRADPGRGSGGAAGYALGRSEPQDDLALLRLALPRV